MKSLMLAAIASSAMLVAGAVNAQQDLAQKNGCLTCHAVDTKKMGPSFKDVAAKYKGKGDAEEKLVAEISGAKGHPPVKASADDVKALVKWILSM
jgi:cytochrome c